MNEELANLRLEYLASLGDLRVNSKPLINNMTMIAQDNAHAFNVIIDAIETRLRAASPRELLPVLYLVDSICKNVGGVYLDAFSRIILRIFEFVYRTVDPAMHPPLTRLLGTWRGIFPEQVVRDIEAFVRDEELRRRPATPPLPAHAHVPVPVPAPAPTHMPIAAMRGPPPPPLAAQHPPAPFELRPMPPPQPSRPRRERYRQPSAQRGPQLPLPPSRSRMPMHPPPPMEDDYLPRGPFMDDFGMRGPPAAMPLPQLHLPPPPHPLGPLPASLPPVIMEQPLPHLAALHMPARPPMPLHSLFGTVPLSALAPTNDALKLRYAGGVESLYDALPKACSNCGFRFPDTPQGQVDLEEHLNWHFRRNKREKEMTKKAVHRDWFLPATLWLTPGSAHQRNGDGAGNVNGSAHGEEQAVKEEPKPQVVPVKDASGRDSEGVCSVCGEPIERFFDNDLEAWMFRDAVRIGDKVYHVACSVDAELQQQQQQQQGSPLASPKRPATLPTAMMVPDIKKIKLEI